MKFGRRKSDKIGYGIINHMVLAVLFAAFVTIIAFNVALYYPFQIFKPNVDDMKTDKVSYIVGETIKLHRDACKTLPFKATIITYFENGIRYELAQRDSNMPVGCQVIDRSIEIPPELPVGKYKIVQINRYKIFWFREIEVISKTDYFSVVK